MGNRKISELAAPGPLTGAEEVPVVQGGETVRPPLSATADYAVQTASSYQPPGTGSVARAPQAKLRERVSVDDYRLDADPDDTLSFTRACTYAATIGADVFVPSRSTARLISSTITIPNGVKIVGQSTRKFPSFSGSWVKRTAAVVMFKTDDAAGITSGCGLSKLLLDGDQLNADIVRIAQAGNVLIRDCTLTRPGTGRHLLLRNQVQDSWFERNYFDNGVAGGTVASVEIDDSLGTNAGHNQNNRFLYCTWEACRERALHIWGVGTGPGNTLMQFKNCKFEALTSNQPLIDLADAKALQFDRCLTVSQGSGVTIPAQFRLVACSRIEMNIDALHLGAGSTLTALASLTNCANVQMTFWPADGATVDNLGGAFLVALTGTFPGVTARTSYQGAKTIATQELAEILSDTRQVIDATNATVQELWRNGGADTNTAVRVRGGAAGDIYYGKDSTGRFSVALTANLDTYLFRVDRSGNIFQPGDVGIYVGAGSPNGVVVAAIGAIYRSTTGGAGTTLYVKESGSGTNTGWVAK